MKALTLLSTIWNGLVKAFNWLVKGITENIKYKYYVSATVIIIALFMFTWCNRKSAVIDTQTTITHDTTWVVNRDSINLLISELRIKPPFIIQYKDPVNVISVEEILRGYIPVDSLDKYKDLLEIAKGKLASRCDSIREYSDSTKMKYGYLSYSAWVLGDLITMKWKTDFKFPIITTSITTPAKVKNSLFGSIRASVLDFNVNIELHTTKGFYIGIGAVNHFESNRTAFVLSGGIKLR